MNNTLTQSSFPRTLFDHILLWSGAGIILITAVVTSAYILLSQSIRLDEAQSIWVSTKPVGALLVFISQDVAAPLYALILHFWIQIFGTDIFWARILSLIFFIATLPFLYKIARESSNTIVAVITLILFTVSPFIIWYTSEARMYTLFTLVTSINHLYFLKMVRSRGRTAKFGYGFSAVLGLYTHYFFTFLLATQFVYIVLTWFLDAVSVPGNKAGSIFRKLYQTREVPVILIKTMMYAGIFFVPWVVFVVLQGSVSNTQPLIPPPTSFNIFQTFVNFIFGFQSTLIQSVLISLWPCIVILLLFVFTQRRTTKISNIEYFILATFLPIILVFLLSFIRPIFLSRYLILVTPTLFFILSWLLMNNSRRVSSILISILIASMFGLLVYQNISAATPVKEDYQGVSQFLEQHASPRDIIAVSAPFTIYPIEYTYRGPDRIDSIPLWNRYTQGTIPSFSLQKLKDQVKNYTQQYDHLFVVLSYDQGYEKDIILYLDMHYKRNTLKQFSPGLEVREYQLRYY